MARTVTYNGLTLTVTGQPGKGSFSGTDRTLRLVVPFTLSGANTTAAITTLRAQNKDVVISLGTWTATYTVGTNAVAVRSDVQKIGSPDDSDAMKRFALTLDIDLITTFADGFAEWQSNDTVDERDAKTIEITGRVTAQAATASSLAVFNAGIGAIQTMVEGYFDSAEYEQPADAFQIDRLNRSLTFSRRLVELLQYPNTSTTYDDTIVLNFWSITRVNQFELDRGRSDVVYQQYRVDWRCSFPKTKTDMVTQYDGTIRTLVTNKIRSVFTQAGDKAFVLRTDDMDFNPTTCQATGNWLVDATSFLMEYSETVEIPNQFAQSEKILDRKPFTEAVFTPGHRARLVQTVHARTRTNAFGIPSAPALTSLGGAAVTLVYEGGVPKREQRLVGKTGGGIREAMDYILDATMNYIVVARSGTAGSSNVKDVLPVITKTGDAA